MWSASRSARRPIARPLVPAPSVPTTPVFARPRCTSSPNAVSRPATTCEVRCSSNAVSGWAWMSRRHAVMSPCSSRMRSMIGMPAMITSRSMRQHIQGIDHVVLVVRDLDAARDTFERMGFTVTPRGHHTIGSQNHCVMFGHDYIELLMSPADDPHPSRRYYTEFARGG